MKQHITPEQLNELSEKEKLSGEMVGSINKWVSYKKKAGYPKFIYFQYGASDKLQWVLMSKLVFKEYSKNLNKGKPRFGSDIAIRSWEKMRDLINRR